MCIYVHCIYLYVYTQMQDDWHKESYVLLRLLPYALAQAFHLMPELLQVLSDHTPPFRNVTNQFEPYQSQARAITHHVTLSQPTSQSMQTKYSQYQGHTRNAFRPHHHLLTTSLGVPLAKMYRKDDSVITQWRLYGSIGADPV